MTYSLALAPLAALLVAILPACGDSEETAPRKAVNAQAPGAKASTAANSAAPAPAPAHPASCGASAAVELDASSFGRDDVPAFSPSRLETFREAAAAAFRAAAEAACAAGEVDRARMAGIRRVLVQSASGATETAFYEDQESAGAGTLVFQYIFTEADLALPEAADIREGLACWADPERAVCAERQP